MQTANESHPDSRRVDSYSNDSDRDLYTIPSYSSWFSWDEIHQNEKIAHSDYFNNTSISKTPKIYKEYRHFIINKFREDPTRRLTFTEVRKCLIGDVGSVHKIFRFLENWGLINFGVRPSDVSCDGAENLGRFDSGARSSDSDCNRGDEDEVGPGPGPGRLKVVVEEGAPNGIRVAEFPNSTKVLAAASAGSGCEEVGEDGFRLPPLTSYSDAFGEAGRKKGCWNCGAVCVSGYYESVKQGGSVICAKCFKNENYEESKLADDFKLIDVDGTGNFGTDVWTDSETMLLLEAVTKYGADWNLAERHVRTKTKLDCISRLIQLPFGEHLLNGSVINGVDRSSSYHASDVKEMGTTSAAEPQEEPSRTEDQHHECMMSADVAAGQIEDGDGSGRPLERRCISTSSGDAGSSLMKQVARLSTIVGPHVAAATAKAAVASLCNENPCARKFYEAEEDNTSHDLGFPTLNNETTRVIECADTDMVKPKLSDSLEVTPEKSGPSTLQIRVAIATALGAAAAHAKLLADQEEREMEHLMATIIEAQLRKIECKVKHFEELELIMEKEYSQVQQLKDSNLSDRIEVLQHAFNAGISSWKDHSSKLSTDHLL